MKLAQVEDLDKNLIEIHTRSVGEQYEELEAQSRKFSVLRICAKSTKIDTLAYSLSTSVAMIIITFGND